MRTSPSLHRIPQILVGLSLTCGAGTALRAQLPGVFTDVRPIGATVTSEEAEGRPTVSADGRTLLFWSLRSGGPGDADIWMATRPNTETSFSAPTSLGLNTAENDWGPHLSADGCTLYFGSTREGGLGGIDIYVATLRRSREEVHSCSPG